jgi:hypothetical protein
MRTILTRRHSGGTSFDGVEFQRFSRFPILHSKDLVNWRIGHALNTNTGQCFSKPQHGNGVWAPAIRYHNKFFVFFLILTTGSTWSRRSASGPWSAPLLIKSAKGWIDPCPFWDDDGNAYLVHAFANSRAGIKSVLHINKMSADGTKLLDEGRLVFDGHERHPTIEGPKLYKRDGYYYIFAPAGGVPTGWQTVLRSKTSMVLTKTRSSWSKDSHRLMVLTREHGWNSHRVSRGSYISRIAELTVALFIFNRCGGWMIGQSSASMIIAMEKVNPWLFTKNPMWVGVILSEYLKRLTSLPYEVLAYSGSGMQTSIPIGGR